MKYVLWFSLLLILVCLPGNADMMAPGSITITSDGTAADSDETNSLGLLTISIAKHPAWSGPFAGSSWVSYARTGDPGSTGYLVAPSGVVSFFDSFVLPGAGYSGVLMVLADDSAGVYLNGNLLMAEAASAGNGYGTCSDFAIGCLDSKKGVLNLTPHLVAGVNTLEFRVAQRAGSSFGLDYAGQLSAVPEPSSVMLLASAVLGLGLLLRRKTQV